MSMRDRFVYFDLGNVLVKFDHAIATRQLAELAGCSFAASQFALFDSGLETRYETGLVNSADFASEINRQLGTRHSEACILEAVSAIFEPNPDILKGLEHIRATGVGIGLLSNTCEGHWEWLRRQRWATVEGWFAPVVLSYEAKSMKPDTAIYLHCERCCGFSGSQIFFTDDRADNIAAAAARGWETYQFGSTDGLIAAFDLWWARG
jgi:HAD superfamily hydrolase (TIGR01509 family)